MVYARADTVIGETGEGFEEVAGFGVVCEVFGDGFVD